MHRREELLADWRRRLEGLARAPRSSITRIYARVLRYLLQRYSRPEEAGGWQELPAAEPAGLVVWSGIELKHRRGKPPKSAAAIRAVLDKAHEANAGRVATGELRSLTADHLVALTSFRQRPVATDCQQALASAGIAVRVDAWSRPVVLFVRRADVDAARAIVERQGFAACDRRPHADPDRAAWLSGAFLTGMLLTCATCAWYAGQLEQQALSADDVVQRIAMWLVGGMVFSLTLVGLVRLVLDRRDP